MTNYEGRRKRSIELMKGHGIDAMFIMKPANLFWLTGDSRPCALGLLTQDGNFTVSVPNCDVAGVKRTSNAADIRGFASEEDMFHGFRKEIESRGLARSIIGLEKNFFDSSLHDVFVKHVLGGAKTVSASPVLSALRMIKDADEIAAITRAAEIADVGMSAAFDAARPGSTEIDVAAAAEMAMRRAGAEGWAIPLYVASGWRSAMAHGPATTKTIDKGDVIQIHVSPIVAGYTAELCRTVLLSDAALPPIDALASYQLAQSAGILAAQPGAELLGIDSAMSAVLVSHGYDGSFLRPVFHGVGIEHEEAPIPGGHALVHGETEVAEVQKGMVLAIGNCGIYAEGFGVRREDTIVVTKEGPKVLTKHS
jgi:Xaa-Pro dipeptidase